MPIRLVAALSLAAAAFAGPLVAPAEAASAATDDLVPAGWIGSDASFPQCKDDGKSPELKLALPVEPAFGIVGVNGGLGNTNNACFAAELQWALTATAVTSQPRVGLYVNTQNPGLQASWWPRGNATQTGTPVDNPFGTCAADGGPACAYVYGYSMAEADVTPAIRHVALPAAYTWWLDIETSNDWSADRTANRAVLEGMVAKFSDVDAPVGLYSTHSQWDRIVGALPPSSPLAALPSWLAGAVTQRGAAENCTHAPLSGGPVTLAQWWDRDRDLDFDLACRQFPVTRIPTVSGAARVGVRLTASAGSWSPGGIDFGYRWLRDGRAIAGATHASYRVQPADAGARISVRVTGTKLAYTRATRTSAAVLVAPRPTTTTPTTASGAAHRRDGDSPAFPAPAPAARPTSTTSAPSATASAAATRASDAARVAAPGAAPTPPPSIAATAGAAIGAGAPSTREPAHHAPGGRRMIPLHVGVR